MLTFGPHREPPTRKPMSGVGPRKRNPKPRTNRDYLVFNLAYQLRRMGTPKDILAAWQAKVDAGATEDELRKEFDATAAFVRASKLHDQWRQERQDLIDSTHDL